MLIASWMHGGWEWLCLYHAACWVNYARGDDFCDVWQANTNNEKNIYPVSSWVTSLLHTCKVPSWCSLSAGIVPFMSDICIRNNIYMYLSPVPQSPSTWLNPFKTGPGLEFKFRHANLPPPPHTLHHPTPPPSRWATVSARPGRGLGKGGGRGHRARC